MYVIKNALRSITRSKGRNLLIGIIVFVIAVSACLGLSIRQAAETAKGEALDNITITAQISIDRNTIMNNLKNNSEESGGFDKSAFHDSLANIPTLSVEEMLTYAKLDSVSDFYYASTISVDGNDELEPVSATSSDDTVSGSSDNSSTNDTSSDTVNTDTTNTDTANTDTANTDTSNTTSADNNTKNTSETKIPEDKKDGFRKGTFGNQGDFTIIGYSSDAAMTDFIAGTSSITDGSMFENGTEAYNCIISDELASYNELSVGDEIQIKNPNADDSYTLTITGIYTNTQATVSKSNKMNGFSTSTDPANQIYLSYNALKNIISTSEANATVSIDENTGVETTTAIPQQLSGTYVFSTIKDYESFSKDVYKNGLSENYTVSSDDVTSYEQSILPLENLSEMAFYFLLVVLGIGAIVLIVLNIFNIRERKYEVGVLTSIGMKKHKVSIQFMFEILVITLAAVSLGAVAGTSMAVPVTNSLLESQVKAQEAESSSLKASFGRENSADSSKNNTKENLTTSNSDKKADRNIKQKTVNYISKVNSATNLSVLIKLLGIGIGLALIASASSIIFIMRYDPLKILANRD